MSLAVDGFKSSKIFDQIKDGMDKLPEEEKKATLKKTNGIFEIKLKNDAGKEETWSIDLKKKGECYKGPAKPKADCTLSMADSTFQDLADGKLNGQRAFMGGKLKVKGNLMLSTKLDSVLKQAQSKI